MTAEIPPARPIAAGRRVTQRRAGDPAPQDASRDATDDQPKDLRPAATSIADPASAPPPRSRLGAFAVFAAQLLGQGGQKRGLRGGRQTLDHARSAYLETEWSGPSDRRIRAGRITRTEV